MATKMIPEVKAKLTANLRSGEYLQGRHALRPTRKDNNGWCCLGVGCDLFRKETGKGEWIVGERENMLFIINHEDGIKEASATMPSSSVIKWMFGGDYRDHSDIDWLIKNGEQTLSLPGANDDRVSFDRLADIIDEQM